MKNTLVILLVIATLGAAIWFGALRSGGEAPAATAQQEERGYDFEAQGVVIRQMDERGRLQYEAEAERIVQLPDRGQVEATGLTLHHDPPGTTPGGPNRWTLTAAQGQLPAEGQVITLNGAVRAQGVPQGRALPLQVATDQLTIDLNSQEVATDGRVDITLGRNKLSSTGMRGNVATGELKLQSKINGTIFP